MNKNLSVKSTKNYSNSKIAIFVSILLIIGLLLSTLNNEALIFNKYDVFSQLDIYHSPVGSDNSWWNSEWIYRKQITIDHDLVEDTLVNFPILISIQTDENLSTHAQSDGDDIVFIDSSGNKLNHEIELYNSITGKLISWVNIPILTSDADTIFYMYYGNSTASNQQNVEAVWDSNYVMVQHLEENDDEILDSTSNNNDGISHGTTFTEEGYIGGGHLYTGDDYITVDDFTHLSTALTAEGWIFINTGSYVNIYSKGTNFDISDWALYLRTASQDQGIDFGVNNHSNRVRAGSTPEGSWFYLTATYDAGDVILFVNNTQVGSGNVNTSIYNNFNNLGIGNDNDGGQGWNGYLDELRISNIARNASWISTSYLTMNNPDLFFDIGSEEMFIPEEPVVSNPIPANGATDVDITLSFLSFDLIDYQSDSMDYSVETYPDIGHDSRNGVINGSYYVLVSGLEYDTIYTWYINITDPQGSGNWVNETFVFTTESYDSDPPIISNIFAGNPGDSGGPYFLPETDVLANEGYYVNDSYQEEDWIYINCSVDDLISDVVEVRLHWLNETSWTNSSYIFNNTYGNFYEFNSSGIINDIASGFRYSFDIWAIDSEGNEVLYQWTKRGDHNLTGHRIFVKLNGIPTDISYTSYYLNSADYSAGTAGNGYGPVPSPYNADVLHHDQGPDGTTTDTGYLVFNIPTDYMQERYCAKYTGYWFDETITPIPDTLGNIYYHNWWSTISKTVEFGYGKTRKGLYNNVDREQYFDASNETAHSQLSYNNREFYLEASLMEIDDPLLFGDNDIYEFFISHYTFYGDDPIILNNRSIMSFVIFNVPDNITLRSIDTDNDDLDDYTELYITYTSPFFMDTDNDGVDDYIEYYYGSDPNNYTDTVTPPDEIFYEISINEEWNLISMPVNQSIDKDDIIIHVFDVNYTWDEAVDLGIILNFIYEWNGQSYCFVDVFSPGKGYWIYSYTDCEFIIYTNSPNNDTLITELNLEWNLISLPFDESVLKNDLIIIYNGSIYTWDQAVSNGLIVDYLYKWEGSVYYFVDNLQSTKGYWMYSYYECILKKQHM